MSEKFNPRDIPHRDHYDRLETWAMSVLGRLSGKELSEMQADLMQNAKEAVRGDDDAEKVIAMLAEIGFCRVIDAMAEVIEREGLA